MDQEVNNGSLGKKLIVPLVAVALFAVLVFGATYAYFAANVQNTNVTNIQATIPDATTGFTTTANTCSFTVDPARMVNSEKSNTTALNTSSCYLNVEINGAANVMCSYDLVITEKSAKAYVPITNAAGDKEFTATLAVESNQTGGTTGLPQIATAKNMDQIETTPLGSTTLNGTTKIQIKVETTNQPIHHKYTLTQNWYNIDADQTNHKTNTYIYELSADNVQC